VSRTAGTTGLRTAHLITTAAADVPDDGRMAEAILAAGDLLQARAIVVLHAAPTGMPPATLAGLAAAANAGQADLVAPVYNRTPSDGVLVTQVLRPLVRGVLGWRLQEPLLQEFACSGRLATHCTRTAGGLSDAQRVSRIWITAEALHGGFTVIQHRLGPRRLEAIRRPAGPQDVVPGLVGSAFAVVDAHSDVWLESHGSEEIPTTGEDGGMEPVEDRPAGAARFIERFAGDVDNLRDVLNRLLEPGTLAALVAASTSPTPTYPDELWATTLAEFLVAFHHGVMLRDHVVQALTPLYAARAGVFLTEYAHCENEAAARAIDALGACVERMKPRIVERWATPA
jgi:hypothetical protein